MRCCNRRRSKGRCRGTWTNTSSQQFSQEHQKGSVSLSGVTFSTSDRKIFNYMVSVSDERFYVIESFAVSACSSKEFSTVNAVFCGTEQE